MMRLRSGRALILSLLLALGTCNYYFGLLLPEARSRETANGRGGGYSFGGDLYPIWLTSRELFLHHRDPYTPEMTREIQIGLFGRPMDPHRAGDPAPDFRAFSYPLFADLLAIPLIPMSFNALRVLFCVALPLVTIASLICWWRALDERIPPDALAIAAILLLTSYPVLEGLYLQQVGLLVAAALALSVTALVRKRLALAGLLLALAFVKPQLAYLLTAFLALWAVSDWNRRKPFVFSFALATATLLLVSQLVLPGWIANWIHSLGGYSHYTLPPLSQLVLGRFLGLAATVAAVALLAAVCWRTRLEPAGSAGFSLAISFVMAVTVILLPTGNAVFEHVLLLPAVLWLAFHRTELLNTSRPLRLLTLLVAGALGWQWIASCAIAVASLVSPNWATNPAVVVLPTRMAAPLPFAVLALLSLSAVGFLRGRSDAIATRPKRVVG